MTFKRLTARQEWVTKSDLSRWYRCPNAFWLYDTGQIKLEDTVSDFQRSLMDEGQEYHERVEQSAAPVPIAPADLPALLRTDATILGTPLFRNRTLKLRGRPDFIEAAGGALYPVEIKSHRKPTQLDLLELAFYWLLLEPHRTRKADPSGVLILRRGGKPFRMTVPITDVLLEGVKRMIADIRAARRDGVTPRMCGCAYCAGPGRDALRSSLAETRDVSALIGVDGAYGRALRAAGYPTWQALIECDPAAVAAAVTATGAVARCSPSQVSGWQLHARALAAGSPEFRSSARPPLAQPYITLDLEYDTLAETRHIWLVGAAVFKGDGCEDEYRSWWADSQEETKEALVGLTTFLVQHSELPIVTWAGLGADLPAIRAACARFGLARLDSEITRRHVDAYRWAEENVRLPTLSLQLKEVADYFGFRRISSVSGGQDALGLYREWRRTRDEQIRNLLIGYNRDDLGATDFTISRLGELHASSPVTDKTVDCERDYPDHDWHTAAAEDDGRGRQECRRCGALLIPAPPLVLDDGVIIECATILPACLT